MGEALGVRVFLGSFKLFSSLPSGGLLSNGSLASWKV